MADYPDSSWPAEADGEPGADVGEEVDKTGNQALVAFPAQDNIMAGMWAVTVEAGSSLFLIILITNNRNSVPSPILFLNAEPGFNTFST